VRPPSRRLATLVAAAVVATGATLVAEASGLLDRTEAETVALRQHLLPADPPSDVAVVGIDEDTFAELGRSWPFPRRLHARVIDRLREAGARTIVYDIQFTEPTRPAQDMALYRALERTPGTVLATGESDAQGRTNVLGGDDNLAAVGARAGASNVDVGDGGRVSRYRTHVGLLPTLPIVAVEAATGRPPPASAFDDGRAWIDVRGPARTIPTLSFSDVLRGRFDPSRVAGRIVVVGATAATFQDYHETPAGEMTGAELQANAIWTALHANPRRDAPAWVTPVAIAVAASAAPLLAIAAPLWLTALAALALAAAWALAAQWAFARGVVLPVAGPLVGAAAGLLAAVVGGYVLARRDGRRAARRAAELDEAVRRRTRELRDTQLEILQRLGRAAEMRDDETGAHIQRIAALVRDVARRLGLPEPEVELLEHASTLHDVGKVGIPDRILLKPGPLDDVERAEMQHHTTLGGDILSGSDSAVVQMAEQIARTHHERWDGTGYPAGLRGEEIPLAGRICAVCDVFDALVSERRYKAAWPLEQALETIAEGSGSQFDPRVVEALLAVVGDAGPPAVYPPPALVQVSPADTRS